MMLHPSLIIIADFLNTIIIDSPFFFLNLWSIVHFVVGWLIMFLIVKLKIHGKKFLTNKIMILLYLLLLWELFEFIMVITNTGIIKAEPYYDIIWDLIWGMLGGLNNLIFLKITSKK